ncbi:MAG: uridine kinase [Fusobacteriia bacterium 4572_132]|nr:MAG: uridine kinase [Fusobacteriia bacterium 4572_132]
MKVVLVGVAGGTGSGKTTVSKKVAKGFNEDALIIEQDSYYKDISYLPFDERKNSNFDHPKAIDFELLIKHIKDLKENKKIEKPIYDFTSHLRKEEKIKMSPKKVVIVEGILIFAIPELRELFDIKLFIDTDEDERLLRRIERDMQERKRNFIGIKEQYLKTVKPMYLEFVEPSKRYADIIIPRGGENTVAIKMIIAKLKKILKDCK